MPTVNLEIKPRSPFREFLQCKKRWITIVAHRRAGKTVAVVQKLILEAMTHKRKGMKTAPLRYAYVAPTQAQAKSIAWNYLVEFTAEIPNVEVNASELRVTLPNGAQIRLFSGENYERMRGLYFDGVVTDEDDDIPPLVDEDENEQEALTKRINTRKKKFEIVRVSNRIWKKIEEDSMWICPVEANMKEDNKEDDVKEWAIGMSYQAVRR